MIYPVITLYQPWAIWIMREWKTIETRTHNKFKCLNRKYILIHAGQTTDGSELTTRNPYLTHDQIIHKPDEVVNGYILGSAYVYDYGPLDDRYSQRSLIDCKNTQRYGLFLQSIRTFETPLPCLGSVGIWYFDLQKRIKVKKPTPKVTPQINLFS